MDTAAPNVQPGPMLTDHYRLHEHPFRMTPDARMYFPSKVHSRAHAHLAYGLAQMEGFVVITGEVGAGKTTLVDRLCTELDPAEYAVARIAMTQVSATDLLVLLAEALGLPPVPGKGAQLGAIAARLRGNPARQLLIVDEAQGLPREALEELRMLSNVTGGNRALLQIILLGQPQLRRTLAGPELDQLRQRILASYHLGPLSEEEVADYVQHRMRAAGWDGQHPSWEPDALRLAHVHSGGIPRRINRLCARVLLAGELERADTLTAAMVEATAQELDSDLGGVDAQPELPPPPSLPADLQQLSQRIDALERLVLGREHIFNHLRDLFTHPRE